MLSNIVDNCKEYVQHNIVATCLIYQRSNKLMIFTLVGQNEQYVYRITFECTFLPFQLLGWNPQNETRRMVLIATDATFHIAGEGKVLLTNQIAFCRCLFSYRYTVWQSYVVRTKKWPRASVYLLQYIIKPKKGSQTNWSNFQSSSFFNGKPAFFP